MRVDTSSADDECLDNGPEDDQLGAALVAGERVLANRFGATIRLEDPIRLSGSGPAVVTRVTVASSPFAMPKTLVLKHYAEPSARTQDPFATEAASYQLFTALTSEDRMCPELIGYEAAHRMLVVSDLGHAPTLEDKLRLPDARHAERSLLSWARALGRMHATTAGREADFDALLRRLRSRGPAAAAEPTDVVHRLPVLLSDGLGVRTPESVQDRVLAALERVRTAPYRAFSPVDLGPDNNLVTNTGVRFLDFEHGCVRNALIDIAHLRTPFAFWDGALGMPAGMSEAMIAAWRAEIIGVWPALSNDAVLAEGLLDCQLRCVWWHTIRALADLLAAPDLAPASRAPSIEFWWRALARHAGTAGIDDVAAHATEVADAVDRRFGPELELPLYPAFRRPISSPW